VVEAQRERSRTLKDMALQSLFFFREFDAFDDKAARKHLTAEAAPLLQAVAAGLDALPDWNARAIHGVIDSVAQRYVVSLGKVAQPLRVAVTGGAVSPPIDVTVALLGPATVSERIRRAVRYLPTS
jgi:glutamyl-tRNA synthetase